MGLREDRVGWFIANGDPKTYGRSTPYTGDNRMPTPEWLSELSSNALKRDDPDLDWFVALARCRSAATWSVIVAHNRPRTVSDATVEAMAPTLGCLLDLARL